jgi:hypothetical protein
MKARKPLAVAPAEEPDIPHRLFYQCGPQWYEIEIRGWFKSRIFIKIPERIRFGDSLVELDRHELRVKRRTWRDGRCFFTSDGREREDAENRRTLAAGQMKEEMFLYTWADWMTYADGTSVRGPHVRKHRIFARNDRWYFARFEDGSFDWIEREEPGRDLDGVRGAWSWSDTHDSATSYYSAAGIEARRREDERIKRRKSGPIRPDDADLLGIDVDASEADVVAAFRRMSKIHHPDQGGTAESFRRLCEAKDRALATLRSYKKGA